jgi:hypothetical protein
MIFIVFLFYCYVCLLCFLLTCPCWSCSLLQRVGVSLSCGGLLKVYRVLASVFILFSGGLGGWEDVRGGMYCHLLLRAYLLPREHVNRAITQKLSLFTESPLSNGSIRHNSKDRQLFWLSGTITIVGKFAGHSSISV